MTEATCGWSRQDSAASPASDLLEVDRGLTRRAAVTEPAPATDYRRVRLALDVVQLAEEDGQCPHRSQLHEIQTEYDGASDAEADLLDLEAVRAYWGRRAAYGEYADCFQAAADDAGAEIDKDLVVDLMVRTDPSADPLPQDWRNPDGDSRLSARIWQTAAERLNSLYSRTALASALDR